MQEDSLKKRYIIKLFANVTSGIIGAVLVAIVPQALGAIAYGQFVYLQDFFMKTIGFLDMGSSMAFFTKLSARHTRKELITFYFIYSSTVLMMILLFILFIETFGYTQKFLPNIPNEYIYMGLFFGFLTWFTQIFIKISDAYALTVSVELIKIGHKIASLLLLLYFVYFTTFDLGRYFYFQYLTLLSLFVILTWLFIKKGIFKNIFNFQFSIFNLTKEFIEYCHPLLILNILVVIVGFLNIWMLQTFGGSAQTGFYGLAYSLATMCFLFTKAMTPVIIREFSKSFAENDIENMRKLFYRYIPMLYSIAAYFGIFISMQSDNVLNIFTDEEFKDASMVLMIMALYPIHQTYGQLSDSIFYSIGNTKLYRNITLFIQPFMLLLSYMLIVKLNLGAIGLGYSMVIVQVIGTNIGLYFNTKFLNLNLKYFIVHQFYSILLFAIAAYTASSLINLGSSIMNFFASGILYTIFIILLTYRFPQIFATTKIEINMIGRRIIKYAQRK